MVWPTLGSRTAKEQEQEQLFRWICFFQYRAERLAGKNVSEITYFVSKGTLSLAPSCIQITAATRHVDVISLLSQVYRPLQQVTQSSNLLEKLCLRRKHRPELHCLVIN